ncbi:family 43 glycosylhydrolase [Sphingomonas sp.]|uniref:family 43 glycosylhydrolase n=1 Tax=Sphingomonas sp. TaxID=28214 RepID=UPI002C17DB13|nr:family 43 glycosylhydrolase [Sphingomonas sp.]HTG39782.1 family 43 glycosylhydrolase [Sphingomonas sp.]
MRRLALIAALALGVSVPALADNPQFQGADPHALMIGDEMWVFPTGGPVGAWDADRFHAFSSTDLKNWRDRGELLRRDQIKWRRDDGAPERFLWAPGVAQANGKWYLYYSLGPNTPKPSHIGVAVADRPEGPYRDSGKPLLTGRKGFEAIDPMVFVDPKSGTPYFYAGGSAGSTLRVFELNPDMVSIKREVAVEQPPQFTEGAFMHERDGTYYLSYSHGRFNGASYSVHYATASSPTGPWQYRGRILSSDATHKGPGHHSFVETPGGETLIVYHRWENPASPEPYKGERQIAIERIRYAPDGSIRPIAMTDGAAAPTLAAAR